MNIYFESPHRLKIELTATDLSELGITYDELDYSSEHTRQVVNDLLSRIGADEEFGPKSKRIIEIFPAEAEGCTMYFTAMRECSAVARKIDGGISVFEIDGVDALYGLAQSLAAVGCTLKISLYLYCDRHRLIINEHIDKKIMPIICEFARKCGGRFAALAMHEHAKLLSDDLLRDLL